VIQWTGRTFLNAWKYFGKISEGLELHEKNFNAKYPYLLVLGYAWEALSNKEKMDIKSLLTKDEFERLETIMNKINE
jgi:hypothetical protein